MSRRNSHNHPHYQHPLHPPHPQRPSWNNAPLPTRRLSPLPFEGLDLPFMNGPRPIDDQLQWGAWRPLPSSDDPHPLHSHIDPRMRPATSPGMREMLLVIDVTGRFEQFNYDRLVRPRVTRHPPVVSVLDVIRKVRDEARIAERQYRDEGGRHEYAGHSVRRENGIWIWRGLQPIRDEGDLWVLYL